MHIARRPLLASPLLVCTLSSACLEVPDFEQHYPPPPDLPRVETWGPLDPGGDPEAGAVPPSAGADDQGPSTDSGNPADPSLAQLKILEVFVDPPGKDGAANAPEFVELHNPGPLAVPLEGLAVEARSWPRVTGADLGLDAAVLAVDGILVIRRWANDVDPALTAVQVEGSTIVTGFIHGDGLRNQDGVVSVEGADVLVYGALPEQPVSGWIGGPAAAPGSGAALCRRVPTTDSNSLDDWSICEPGPGSLEPKLLDEQIGFPTDLAVDTEDGESPIPIEPGAIQIVEVLADAPGPSSEEKFWEFIEIANLSENEVELSHALVGDAETLDAPGVDPLVYLEGDGGCASPTCLAPGRRALIVGMGYLGEVGEALVLATDDSTIADGGLTMYEPVVLWDGLGTMVSSYRVWPDPQGDPHPEGEQPLHRLDPAGADEPTNWVAAPASPGLF